MNYKILKRDNIKNNLQYYRSFGKDLVIMVKSTAYGHGMEEIARLLNGENVKLGVANIDEAERLCKVFSGQILIVEPLDHFERLKENFEFVVENLDQLKLAKKLNLLEKCYLKIDTGMNRFGFGFDEPKLLKRVAKLVKGYKIKGLMTHFSHIEDEEFSLLQRERFCRVKALFGEVRTSFGGSGAIRFDADECRVGIGFYGYGEKGLKPIMEVKAEVLKTVSLKQGEGLGYGNKFIAKEKTEVGVVSLGYGDGIMRDYSGGFVKFKGQNCKIIGSICMDCLFIDITGKGVKKGDFVVMERADVIAERLNTIPYEILTGYSSLRAKVEVD